MQFTCDLVFPILRINFLEKFHEYCDMAMKIMGLIGFFPHYFFCINYLNADPSRLTLGYIFVWCVPLTIYSPGTKIHIDNQRYSLTDMFILGVTARGAKHPKAVPIKVANSKCSGRLRQSLRSFAMTFPNYQVAKIMYLIKVNL